MQHEMKKEQEQIRLQEERTIHRILAEMSIMQRMTKFTDLDEYLKLFESLITGLIFHKTVWSGHLQPHLNDNYRTTLMSMGLEDRQD